MNILAFLTTGIILYAGVVKSGIGCIGVETTQISRTIKKVHPGGPAALAGMQVGDKILAVNDRKYGAIVGPPDELVVIVVKRGDKTITFEIVRQDLVDFPNHPCPERVK